MAKNTAKLIAQIPLDMHRRLKRNAKRNDRPMTSVVRLALEEYLSRQETK